MGPGIGCERIFKPSRSRFWLLGDALDGSPLDGDGLGDGLCDLDLESWGAVFGRE